MAFGSIFDVFDGDRIVGFSARKAFKLKEDIRVYTNESMAKELLRVHARKIIDFSSAYDLIDATSDQKIGAARRKGFKSIARDSWELLDAAEHPLAQLREDSIAMALLRRVLSNLVPQSFHLERGGEGPVVFKQRFNPFIYKLDVEVPRGSTLAALSIRDELR